MNALISVIKNKKDYILANDGRLLKKFIFISLILILASQPGLLGATVQKAMADAYLQVSVFVGFTLLIFIGLDSMSKFNTEILLKILKDLHFEVSSIYSIYSPIILI